MVALDEFCLLSKVTAGRLLERDVAIENLNVIFQCCEQQEQLFCIDEGRNLRTWAHETKTLCMARHH